MEHSLIAAVGHFGLIAVFINVLVDQMGIPVPAVPTLILAGALAVDGKLSANGLFVVAVSACLIGDLGWFVAGRVYGNRVMKLLCRISLTPDSCVSETQQRFERWGANALIFSKFIPGLSIVAPPLAGATRMRLTRFIAFSTLGSALWVGAAVGLGMLLKPQIDRLLPHLQDIGSMAGEIIVVLLILYIAFKWWERRRFFAFLRMARINVNELYKQLDAGTPPVIIDVRSTTAQALEPRRIPGALHVPLQNFERHIQELPRDREIVLYCTCPNEASAAKVAKQLMNFGFKRVRPLYGGLDAWIAAGYAVETIASSEVQLVMAKHPASQ